MWLLGTLVTPEGRISFMRRTGLVLLAAMIALGPGLARPLLGQERGGTVRGTVVDSAGAPLVAVDIAVGTRTTRTNARGYFLLDSLPSGGHTLVARFPGHTPARIPFRISTAAPVELLVRLFPAAFFLPEVIVEATRTGIFGVVVGRGLVPLPGARVQLLGAGSLETQTDSTGAFAFPGVRPGHFLVRATAAGYGEQRSLVELQRGQGRQVRFRLAASRSSPGRAEDAALADLGRRLSTGYRSERLTPAQLDRYETLGVCDLPQIREMLGRSNARTTLILNGSTVMREFTVGSLCSWQADEVDLIEVGGNYCRDVTETIPALVDPRIRCTDRRRVVPGRSYIILWEKR